MAKINPDFLKEHMQAMQAFNQTANVSARLNAKENKKRLSKEQQKKLMHKFLKKEYSKLKHAHPQLVKGMDKVRNYQKGAKSFFKGLENKMRQKDGYQKIQKALCGKGTIKSKLYNAQQRLAKGFSKFKQDPQKYINNSFVKAGQKLSDFGNNRQKQHAKNTIELGHNNVQGLKLVKDPKIKNGYQFEATKNTSFVYGKDKSGKPLKMSLKPGEKTGTIIAKSAQDRKILAGYSHGNKYVRTAIEPGSTMTLDHNVDPNILNQSAYIGNHSDVVLKGHGNLSNGTKVLDSQVSTDKPIDSTAIQNSNVDNQYGMIKASAIKDTNVKNVNNSIHKSLIDGSDVTAKDGMIHDSRLFNTVVNNQHHSSIMKSVIEKAKLNNTNTDTVNLKNGTYNLSNVKSSIMHLNRNAQVNNSKVYMSQAQMPDVRSNNFKLDHSKIFNTTATIPAGKSQTFSNSILRNAVTTNNVKLERSNMQNEKHANIFRNFEANGLNVNLKDSHGVFDNKILSAPSFGKNKNQVYSDQNMPASDVLDPNSNFAKFIDDNRGITGAENHSNPKANLSQQISAIMHKFIPGHRKQISKTNNFFKIPEHVQQHEHAKSHEKTTSHAQTVVAKSKPQEADLDL